MEESYAPLGARHPVDYRVRFRFTAVETGPARIGFKLLLLPKDKLHAGYPVTFGQSRRLRWFPFKFLLFSVAGILSRLAPSANTSLNYFLS